MELDSPTRGYSFRQLRSCLPVEIIPGRVYLGPSSSLTPAVLQLVGISAVCLCAKEHANAAEVVAAAGGEVHVLPLEDSLQQELLPLLPGALHFIEMHTAAPATPPSAPQEADATPRPSSGRVLLACSDGNSRAAALAVACVSKFTRVPFAEALQVVIQAKGDACPNPRFQTDLKEFVDTLQLPPAATADSGGGFFADLKKLSKEAIIARVMFYPSLFGNIVMCNEHVGKWRCGVLALAAGGGGLDAGGCVTIVAGGSMLFKITSCLELSLSTKVTNQYTVSDMHAAPTRRKQPRVHPQTTHQVTCGS